MELDMEEKLEEVDEIPDMEDSVEIEVPEEDDEEEEEEEVEEPISVPAPEESAGIFFRSYLPSKKSCSFFFLRRAVLRAPFFFKAGSAGESHWHWK